MEPSGEQLPRRPTDVRAPNPANFPPQPGPPQSPGPQNLPQRPPLLRTDSRPSIPPPQGPRPGPPGPGVPLTAGGQQSPLATPQFQTGGPINPAQFYPKTGQPAPPRPLPPQNSLPQQFQPRPGPPVRPSGPQSFAPQQIQRPPIIGPQSVPRPPIPSNLQFGPRQPPNNTGDFIRPPVNPNGTARPALPPGPISRQPSQEINRTGSPLAQLSRQSSQASLKGFDSAATSGNKTTTLDNLGEKPIASNENGFDPTNMSKSRSYSIAGGPDILGPNKVEDDRRKSMSVFSGRLEDSTLKYTNLQLIQEGPPDIGLKSSKENVVQGSRESLRSNGSNDSNRETTSRPDSRLSGSKMSESFIGSFDTNKVVEPKKLDGASVINPPANTNNLGNPYNNNEYYVASSKSQDDRSKPMEIADRSPSLNQSDSSPESKVEKPVDNVKEATNRLGNVQSGEPKNRPTNILSPEQKASELLKSNDPISSINQAKILTNAANLAPQKVVPEKPKDFKPPIKPSTEFDETRTRTQRKIMSAPKRMGKDGDNDSGVDESTQGHEVGSPATPGKNSPSKIPSALRSPTPQKISLSRSSSKSATAKTPDIAPAEKKKLPMNKIQVGNAPSPNIKSVKSKIGSLDNSTYKPGGGKVRIENRKLDFNNATPKIAAKNDAYSPGGGVKKIPQTKLQWTAKSKIGSLENATHKPGGGDKKIETVKLDFKDKAKPKVASTVNITHKPGGGDVKIESQKLEIKAQSKVGSLDNVKHKPKGGEIKIFDDKEYLKQMSASPAFSHSGHEIYDYTSLHDFSEFDPDLGRTQSRCRSAYNSVRSPSPRRKLRPTNSIEAEEDFVAKNNEKNLKYARPKSARETNSMRQRVRSSYMASRKNGTDVSKRPPFMIF